MARRVLLISGSTRLGSTNTAACRTAAAWPPAGVHADWFGDLAKLPHFNPDHDHEPLPSEVTELRAAIDSADAVLFCTPEYAGTLPGSFKNLLDWTVGDTVLTDKPVAWLNVAGPGRGHGAQAALETVLGYVGARVINSACVSIPIARDDVSTDGLIHDHAIRTQLAHALDALLNETT